MDIMKRHAKGAQTINRSAGNMHAYTLVYCNTITQYTQQIWIYSFTKVIEERQKKEKNIIGQSKHICIVYKYNLYFSLSTHLWYSIFADNIPYCTSLRFQR